MSDTEDQQPQEVAEVEEETALVNKELTVEVQGMLFFRTNWLIYRIG